MKPLKTILFGACLAALLTVTSSQAANLLLNGDFTATSMLPGGYVGQISDSGYILENWTITSIPWLFGTGNGAYGNAQEGGFGSNFVGLSQFSSLEQSFSVTAGTSYQVSFYQAQIANSDGTGLSVLNTIILDAGGISSGQLSLSAGNTTALSNPGGGVYTASTGWQLFSFTFTPDTTTTATLMIGGDKSYNGYEAVDNYSVMAVPEPSTYALVLGGIATLLLIRRRVQS